MKTYRVTFTIDVNSADKEESFEEAKYQLIHRSYEYVEQINMQSSELIEDDDDDSSVVESDLSEIKFIAYNYGGTDE